MSHFTTLVLVSKDELKVEEVVKRLLAPYDEEIKVPEHEDPCFCIGTEAKRAALKQAEETLGTNMNSLRDKFWQARKEKQTEAPTEAPKPENKFGNLHERAIDDGGKKAVEFAVKQVAEPDKETESRQEANWKKHIASFVRLREKLEKAHPLYKKPEATCEDCKGSGVRKTTYNPKAKWDWWSIGGRWSGILFGDQEASQTLERNMRMVGSLPEYIADEIFAVITPDGKWHAGGKMGWWAIVIDERKGWRQECRQILEANKDCVAVLCDLHI